MVKFLVLVNGQMLISGIEEVGADIGEPDCKLSKPFIYDRETKTMSPWLFEFTNQDTCLISSEKILTIVDPKKTLIDKYEELIK